MAKLVRRAASLLFLLAAAFAAQTQTLAERLGHPPNAKLLIVHADDLGMTHSVNAASIAAMESLLVNSASIMVPGPWLPEIASYARRNPDADFGLHLTLTSEWTTFRWGPVLPHDRVSSLLDGGGYFHLTESEAAARIDPAQAEAEVRAQIGRARAAGIKPTHLDSHMGTLYQTRALFEVLMRVAREEKIAARVSRAQASNAAIADVLRPDDIVIDRIISIGPDTPPERWAEYYTEALRNLQPGVTEVIVHLAFDDAEMRAAAAGHPNWGSAWRQRDFEFFTSARFRALLREHEIRLVSWRELSGLLRNR